MELTQAKQVQGTLRVPADKSISHRSIMFGALANGTTTIHNFLQAEDCLSTLKAFQDLGVTIIQKDGVITVEGVGMNGLKAPLAPLDMGNSGTTTRLMMGILAKRPFDTTLVGDASLSKRPMGRVIDPLAKMKTTITGVDGSEFAPLTVHQNDTLQAIEYTMPVASAQVKSAILFAALQATGTTVIHEKEASRNHTEEMIRQFDGKIDVDGLKITVTGPQELTAKEITVPGDISSAAFFLVAGAIAKNSELILENVGINPTRTGILDVLSQMGANLEMRNLDEDNQAADLVISSSELEATTIKGEIIPRLIDELPVIALLATQARGVTVIKDAQELKVKETNRIDATAAELKKLGADITATEDGLIIKGPTKLHGGIVDSHKDHRIGMMLQIAALLTDEVITLNDPEAVAISYPHFFDDFKAVTQETIA